MVANWYYQHSGTVHGPVSSSEMRKLAASGNITPSTCVRPANREQWITAGQVRGLFSIAAPVCPPSNTSEPPPQDGGWYVRDHTGKTFGPVTRGQLDEWYQNDQISETCQIRHKEWSEWRSAVAVYPDLDEGQFDWADVRKRMAEIWQFVLDHVQAYSAGLTIKWSPTAPHLRRCIADFHHQFSTHRECIQCGSQTIGTHVNDVANGDDAQLQQVHGMWVNSKRRVARLAAWSLVVSVILSLVLFFTTWWFLLLVPLTLTIGLAFPISAAYFANARIQDGIGSCPNKLPHSISEQQIDEIESAYVGPFLRRNEATVGTMAPHDAIVLKRLRSLDHATEVFIGQKELRMLEQILVRKRLTIWTTSKDAQLVLNAFALRSDYALFRQRIEHLESGGVTLLVAYASLVNHDEALLPFLQQLLTERQIPASESFILDGLAEVRHDLKLKGFEKDLEQRRHGSMSITIEMVDAMDPYNFELLLGMIYETLGFRVIETPKSGDQGADVFLEKAGERTVVQAKLYSDMVGNKAVQEVIAARSHFRCHSAAVVTNNFFTSSAQSLARSSGVQLVDRRELTQMVADFNRNAKDYARLVTLMDAVKSAQVRP